MASNGDGPPFARPDSPWSLLSLDSVALPPASRQRQIEKLANDNLSNGYPLFLHYVQPTLELRREALIDSGATRKKFYKSVGKLWFDLPLSQKAFWNGEAARLRVCLKQKEITHEECLRCVGSPDSWITYIEHAETAVAEYLNIPMPFKPDAQEKVDLSLAEKGREPTAVPFFDMSPPAVVPVSPPGDLVLLDTLPDRFTVEPRMLYGHFARYDLDDVRRTPTRKRQMEKLRQLADLFDQTGKVLFYYYAYPRLWKRLRPLEVDEKISTIAQDTWHYAEGATQEMWRVAELDVKKTLGDGELCGLDLLCLDSLDQGVVRLHAMAEDAVSARLEKVERAL